MYSLRKVLSNSAATSLLCFVLVGTFIFFLLEGCKKTSVKDIPPMTAKEYEVIETAVIKKLGCESGTGIVAIINDTTSINELLYKEQYKNQYKLLCEDLRTTAQNLLYIQEPALQQCVEDFIKKNAKQSKVECFVKGVNRLQLMTGTQIQGELAERRLNDWERFKKKYPNIRAMVTASRVGFSEDEKYGLLFLDIAQGPLEGAFFFYPLRKHGDTWEIMPYPFGPSIVY